MLLPFALLLCCCYNVALAATTPKTTLAVDKQDPICLLPLEAGPCRMSLDRYYYNAQTNSCETFKFGGCRGNDNRFGFRKTCEDACLRKVGVTTTDTTTFTPKAAAISTSTQLPPIARSTIRAVAATTEKPTQVLVTG